MTELKLQQCRLDGRYDIQECLGRGSYAEIYVARDLAAREGEPRTVVIKALNVNLQGEPDAELEATLIANFQNEAIALDRVRHPNIISRLGHGTAIDLAGTTFHYIVLEFMAGGDIAARCRNRPFTIDETLGCLQQVCAGLAHAHSRGIIHRDIKPQNLLLGRDQKFVKIADFGVARMETSEGVITRVGTNVYAPPEHHPLMETGPLDPNTLEKHRNQLTPAADVYSLAKTTYTILAGEPPRKFAQQPVTGFPARISGEPWAAGVLDVIRRGTLHNAADRIQTVQEFWMEMHDAAQPVTQILEPAYAGVQDLKTKSIQSEKSTAVPPRPVFDSSRTPARTDVADPGKRPRIVVPIQTGPFEGNPTRKQTIQKQRDVIDALPDAAPLVRQPAKSLPVQQRLAVRFVVAIAMIFCFAGMLWATHYYISRRKAADGTIQQSPNGGVVAGNEGITLTDVNLRSDASLSGAVVGMAERGSRVRIRSTKNNACEVDVLQHGRAKTDPDSLDRGWINRKYLDSVQ
jgi:serine/threonine protein kinase